MRFATAATAAVVGATAAVAQLPLPTSGSSGNLASQALSVFGQLSPQCQSTVYGLLSSPVVECLNIPQSVNVLITAFSNTNASIIAPIDQLLAIDCNSSGCSNSTLQSFAQNITTGCGTDLAKYNISSSLVDTVVEQYPLAREVVCLRTSDYNSTTSSNVSTIPITSPPYNIINDTAFCATSLLTEVSQKVGSNLTIPFFVDLYDAYKNNSLTQFTSKFNFSTTDICNECIFAAADVIGVAYPQVGNLTLAEIGFNSTSVSNVTLSQALDGQCAAYNLTWNSNGTLPANVTSGAVNSTFGFNLTSAANSTNSTSSTVAKRNVVDIKARWVGQI